MALLFSTTSWAYDWAVGPPGPNFSYHMCNNELSATEIVEIQDGFEAWEAGSTEILRGAEVNAVRNLDRPTCGLNNFVDEVYDDTSVWFANHGCSGFIACHIAGINDSDIVFNHDETWSMSLPSNTSSFRWVKPLRTSSVTRSDLTTKTTTLLP